MVVGCEGGVVKDGVHVSRQIDDSDRSGKVLLFGGGTAPKYVSAKSKLLVGSLLSSTK